MDYISLKNQIVEAGLLKRQYGFYAFISLIALGLMALSIYFLVTITNFGLQLLNAVFLSFIMVQFAHLLHDSRHQEIFKSEKLNNIVGLIFGDLLLATSSAAWMRKHNIHHSSPNHISEDPDIDISLLAFSEEQALAKKGTAQAIVKYQAYFFFPILMLTAISKRYNLFRTLIQMFRASSSKYYLTDFFMLGLGSVLYIGGIFYFLSPGQAITFILVNQAFLGLYLGTIFATNHKGMPLIKDKGDFLRLQVITARNVKGNPLLNYWMGGLNYQIEHHLFPTMPRNNLGKAREIIKPFCEKQGIEYYETGFFQSYKEILQHFHQVGAVLRRSKKIVSKHATAQ